MQASSLHFNVGIELESILVSACVALRLRQYCGPAFNPRLVCRYCIVTLISNKAQHIKLIEGLFLN